MKNFIKNVANHVPTILTIALAIFAIWFITIPIRNCSGAISGF